MPVPEDTYLNRIPYTLTHALKGELDPDDRWKELLMAVESSQDDGAPLDPDFKTRLDLSNQRRESPTEKLLSELGTKGYLVCHLRKWLRARGLQRAANLLEGAGNTCASQCLYCSCVVCFYELLSVLVLCLHYLIVGCHPLHSPPPPIPSRW